MEINFEDRLKDIFFYNKQELWQELIMVRLYHKFYIPGWTLGVEMVFSLMIPVFIYTARSNIKMIWWFLPVSLFMGNYISMFAFHFALGILLAYYYPKIQSYSFKTSRYFKYRYGLILIVGFLFSMRHVNRMISFGNTYDNLVSILKIDFFHFSGKHCTGDII